MDDDELHGQSLDALLDRARTAPNAFEQQRFRDAVITHGAPAIAAIQQRRWLCDRAICVFASQIVREIGRKHPEDAEAALRAALLCASDACLTHVVKVAKDLDIHLPPTVGAYMPSYMRPDSIYHVVADRIFGPDIPYGGGMYLSKCGWVLTSRWVEEHLDQLDPPHQHLCGLCRNAK